MPSPDNWAPATPPDIEQSLIQTNESIDFYCNGMIILVEKIVAISLIKMVL